MRGKVVATIWLLCGSLLLCAQPVVHRLQDVKAIYVAPMDGENVAVVNLINAKLVSHLAKNGGVSVVESEDIADAILIGSALIQTTTNTYGHAHYHVQAGMRLVSKDGVVLWADDVSSSSFAQSATSSFADNVARRLLQAMFPEKPTK